MCIFEPQAHAGAEHKQLQWSHLRASQSHISTMRQQCLDNLQMTKSGSKRQRSASLHSKSRHTSKMLYCWTKRANHSRSGTYHQAASLHYKIQEPYHMASVVNFHASRRQQIVQQHQVTIAGGEVQVLHCTYEPVNGKPQQTKAKREHTSILRHTSADLQRPAVLLRPAIAAQTAAPQALTA